MNQRAKSKAVVGYAQICALLIACLSIAAMSARAEGQGGKITFDNDCSCRITNGFTGAPVCEADGFQVALFCAPTNSATFTQVGDAITAGWPVTGVFAGGSRCVGGIVDAGATAQFQVRAWPKTFSTYGDAIFHRAPVGASEIVVMPTCDGEALPSVPSPALTVNGLQGFTIIATNQLSITCIDGQAEISFAAAPGQNYVIQCAPSINGPWCDLSSPITIGANLKAAYNDKQVPSATRFYRAVLQP